MKMSPVRVFVGGYIGNFKQKNSFFIFHLDFCMKHFLVVASVDWEHFFSSSIPFSRSRVYFVQLGSFRLKFQGAKSGPSEVLDLCFHFFFGIYGEFSWGIFFLFVRVLIFRLMKGSQNLVWPQNFNTELFELRVIYYWNCMASSQIFNREYFNIRFFSLI